MVKKEFVRTREDGVKLYRAYSDHNMMIQKDGTDEIYTEAIDVENSGFTYTETDIPIEGDTGELTVGDTLEMLNELGYQPMISKEKLKENVNKIKTETKDALQTLCDALNQGQRKKGCQERRGQGAV